MDLQKNSYKLSKSPSFLILILLLSANSFFIKILPSLTQTAEYPLALASCCALHRRCLVAAVRCSFRYILDVFWDSLSIMFTVTPCFLFCKNWFLAVLFLNWTTIFLGLFLLLEGSRWITSTSCLWNGMSPAFAILSNTSNKSSSVSAPLFSRMLMISAFLFLVYCCNSSRSSLSSQISLSYFCTSFSSSFTCFSRDFIFSSCFLKWLSISSLVLLMCSTEA